MLPIICKRKCVLRTQYRSRAGVLEYTFALSSLPCVEMVAVVWVLWNSVVKSPQGCLRYGGDSAYRILPSHKNMLRILQEIKKFDIVYRIREQVRKAAIGLVFCEDDGYISRYRFRAQQGCLIKLLRGIHISVSSSTHVHAIRTYQNQFGCRSNNSHLEHNYAA
mgnify:CR=1 FL=1